MFGRYSAGVGEITLSIENADSPEAVWAMSQYFAELDARFVGGFDATGALDAAAVGFAHPLGIFIIARRDGEVVACGGVQCLDDTTAEIKRMWVSPAARGIGLGKRLLARLEAEAAALGRRRVVLDTNQVLAEAIAMYRSSGYTPFERYSDNPYAHHWFEKPLLWFSGRADPDWEHDRDLIDRSLINPWEPR
jgi:GNAT superfamily N-acetyltransferase